jgi:hypothetical protein
MFYKTLATLFCNTFQDSSAKCFISIDTNTSCSAEVDITGKFAFSDVPIKIYENSELTCIVMYFPEEFKSQMAMLINIFTDYSNLSNNFTHKVDIIIWRKHEVSYIIGSPIQWFIIPENSTEHALMLVFNNNALFSI